MKKLAAEHPEEVRMIEQPEENDGCIYVELPSSWLKIQPKRKIELTDEDRKALRERAEIARKARNKTLITS